MRMSKELAHQIAVNMTAKKQKVVDQLLKDFQKFVTDAYVARTPKLLLSLCKKYPEWFSFGSSVVLQGIGFSYEYVNTTVRIINNGKQNSASLQPDKEIFAEARGLKNKYDAARKELNDLRIELEAALNGLRTFSAIQIHLPEAVPFLPKVNRMEVMINFDSLRNKIA